MRPRVRVCVEHLRDEVFAVAGDVAPVLVVEDELPLFDDPEELLAVFRVLGLKRRVPPEQNVRDDAGAPDVALEVVQLVLDDLRGHVVRRPAHLVEVFAVTFGGEAEVREHDTRVAVLVAQQEVLGLQVAMGDLSVVEEGERLEERLHEQPRLMLRVRLLVADPLKQLAAAHLLCDEVVVFLLVEVVDEGEDVGLPPALGEQGHLIL
mmetsp:Transcript_60321/g.136358  ORF Transcript_60321/g.136358 Transcript_60321/m.136358 type:complete len:207 (-) Transcript_60321:330-950(-)